MSHNLPFPSEPLRILAVADSDTTTRALVDALGDEFAGSVRSSVEPAIADASPAGTEVVLLALGSVAASERRAQALREESRAPGPVILLVCPAAEVAAAARLARTGIVHDYVLGPGESADPDRLAASVRMAGRLARQRLAPRAALPARRPVVVLVEDDPFAHEVVAVSLAALDIELVVEADGGKAIARIAAVRPDVVLMDVNLAGYDGVELTLAMKHDASLSAIPVVIVTGEASRETLRRSLDAGAADFVVKPFTPDALVAKLARFLPAPG